MHKEQKGWGSNDVVVDVFMVENIAVSLTLSDLIVAA